VEEKMPVKGDVAPLHSELRSLAETRLATAPSEGGFWYSVADCQRMVHELHVYEIELDLMGEELAAQQNGLQDWRNEAQRVQQEFKEVAEKISHMEDGPEKAQIGIQCLHATLHLFEERFKLLAQRGIAEAP
jgi:chromosome segregation ATPase